MPPLVPTTVPYYTYLVFAENCVMAVLKLCTVGLMGLLLYSLRCRPNTLRVSRISISMMAYLGTHILCSLITLPYLFYVIFWWQWPSSRSPGLGIYSPYVLFWLGVMQMCYAIVSPLPVLFLTLDRICALKPTKLIGQHRNAISIFGIFFTLAVFALSLFFWAFQEFPLHLNTVALCELTPCLMVVGRSAIQLIFKMVFGTTNFLACIVFLVMLKKAAQGGHINAKNRVVKFAIWSEIFMDLLPAYVSYFTTLIAGISLSSYYGDMLDTLTSLEAAFCALYYWWIFQAKPDASSSSAAGTAGAGGRTTEAAAMAVEVRRSPQQWYNLNHHRVSPSRTANSDSAVVNGGLGRGQIEVFANSPTPRVTFRAAEHQQRQAKQSASRPRVLSNNAF